ncbi:hypothetical protein GCM10009839_69840 [Catenulispora yoronensis]|uniref:Uncharacterized protein n=1 Tax=Catenulispora yoronensis TaxID=450799 RepID=A0ABP5GW01_9ACTN
MHIRISVVDSDSDAEDQIALRSLYRWLAQDLGPDAELTLRPRSAPEAQGGAFEIINALIGDGVGLGGLALSYAAWRQAHRSKARISLERDGLTVTVEDASPEALQRIAEVLGAPAGSDGAKESAVPIAGSPTADESSAADGSSAAQ